MKTVVVGDILIQDNQERKFGANAQYAVVWAIFKGETVPLVFTRVELINGMDRAIKNSEDIPELGSETSINEFDKD